MGSDEPNELEAVDEDFTADELADFLAADDLDVRADPVFRERLRRKLWHMIRSRFGDDPEDGR